MQGRTIGELAHYFKLDGLKLANAEKYIRHLVIDSRKVKKGDVYVAYQGASFDGHAFIEDAIKQGAIAIICEHSVNYSVSTLVVPSIREKLAQLAMWFYPTSDKLNIIATTGTNGKTSIVCLYAQLATLLNESCGILGTIGNGLWPSLKPAARTTDNSLALWQNLSVLAKKTRQVAMEVSSHALDQKRLTGLKLNCVIWSNLSHDHLDYHRTLECYFRAKLKLFHDYDYDYAVINYDNNWGKKILASIKEKKTYSYSICSKDADLYVEVLMQKKIGYRVCLHFNGQQVPTEINLVGQFNLENVAAVVCSYLAKGTSLKLIASRLPQLKPVTGRMEMIKPENRPFIVLDYAHTPDALEKALVTIRSQMNAKQKLWCVFGCGGDRDVSKRAIMASIAEKLSDMIIATSDNPRTEAQELIFQDMKEGFQGLKPILFIESRRSAIEYTLTNANEDDWVLLAGKGHERYQEINGDFLLFDEKEIIDSLSQ
ncbi:MAG: UDP-N-acetylmuramoyl-L-alanyl-D-glutamate--2,6-diaminopimelate ligase [Gammaproteobacteria bacterium]|nr:MAG: UDP-N-acetylmuramoyl-L-alanyl-D-glutamate--2,6-diaminopimelate ligase [Gammaproteobacteria bacterium]UTW43098.1 UDP-N-acetylmuramoyl-L-alanyl-D-glutamate--2,6-diaminopimelate ligase [bacterium SCSIO 12844]